MGMGKDSSPFNRTSSTGKSNVEQMLETVCLVNNKSVA